MSYAARFGSAAGGGPRKQNNSSANANDGRRPISPSLTAPLRPRRVTLYNHQPPIGWALQVSAVQLRMGAPRAAIERRFRHLMRLNNRESTSNQSAGEGVPTAVGSKGKKKKKVLLPLVDLLWARGSRALLVSAVSFGAADVGGEEENRRAGVGVDTGAGTRQAASGAKAPKSLASWIRARRARCGRGGVVPLARAESAPEMDSVDSTETGVTAGVSLAAVASILLQVTRGLAILHESGSVHGSLCSSRVFITSTSVASTAALGADDFPPTTDVALGGWALHSLFAEALPSTATGVAENPMVADSRLLACGASLAPERTLPPHDCRRGDHQANRDHSSPAGDIWSLGILALELLGVSVPTSCASDATAAPAPSGDPHELQRPLLSSIAARKLQQLGSAGTPGEAVGAQRLLDEYIQSELFLLDLEDLGGAHEHESVHSFLRACLSCDPSERATAEELCNHPWLLQAAPPVLLNQDADGESKWVNAQQRRELAEAQRLAEDKARRALPRAIEDDMLLGDQSWYFTKTQVVMCELTDNFAVEKFLEARMSTWDLERRAANLDPFACEGMYLVFATAERQLEEDGIPYTLQLSLCRRSGSLLIGSQLQSEFEFFHIWINVNRQGYRLEPATGEYQRALRDNAIFASLGSLCNVVSVCRNCVPYSPPTATTTTARSTESPVSTTRANAPAGENDLSNLLERYSSWRTATAGDTAVHLLQLADGSIAPSSVHLRHSAIRKVPVAVIRSDEDLATLMRGRLKVEKPLSHAIIPMRALDVHAAVLDARVEGDSDLSESGESGVHAPTAGDAWYQELRLLPLNVREKDVVYQRRRLSVFSTLLRDLSSRLPPSRTRASASGDISASAGTSESLQRARDRLIAEARVDIPWLARGAVWQAVLDVSDLEADDLWRKATLSDSGMHDPDAPTDADKQIELDLPRCHSGNAVINSPYGRRLLRRVLKAWIRHNKGSLVYWQGLDSVAAPFVYLFAGTPPRVPAEDRGVFEVHGYASSLPEGDTVVADVDAPEVCAARALACLQRFVDKYLHNYFLADNHEQLQGHLAVFSQLLAYHDPKLGAHLFQNEFQPNLYAIPWFLTMFTHVLELHQCFPLWDTLIVGPSELPLFVGVAVLRQLSSKILALKDFNQILEMFTDLPAVDVQQLIEDTQQMFNRTPWPATCAEYAMHRRDGSLHSDPSGGAQAVADKISLAQLQEELCPRMFVRDLIEFQSQLALVDLRTAKEFAQLHLRDNALNFPLKPEAEAEDADLEPLERLRGQHIVLCDRDSLTTTSRATLLAQRLVIDGFPHVSVLHGGFEHLVAQTPNELLEFKRN